MFYLVFGESVLNDAVALVLFNIFSKFIGVEFTAGSMAFAVVDFLIIFIGKKRSIISTYFSAGRQRGAGEGKERYTRSEEDGRGRRQIQALLDQCIHLHLHIHTGSMFIGFLFGCASALLFKHIDLRHSIYEMGVYLLLAYIPSLFSAVSRIRFTAYIYLPTPQQLFLLLSSLIPLLGYRALWYCHHPLHWHVLSSLHPSKLISRWTGMYTTIYYIPTYPLLTYLPHHHHHRHRHVLSSYLVYWLSSPRRLFSLN